MSSNSDFSVNYFQGPVPDFFSNQAAFSSCNLSGNRFQCPIPSWATWTQASCGMNILNMLSVSVTDTISRRGSRAVSIKCQQRMGRCSLSAGAEHCARGSVYLRMERPAKVRRLMIGEGLTEYLFAVWKRFLIKRRIFHTTQSCAHLCLS